MTSKTIIPVILLSIFGIYSLSYARDLHNPLKEPYISLFPIPTPGIKDTLNYQALEEIDNIIYRIEIGSFWYRTKEYNTYIWDAAKKYNIPNNLIRAIIYIESNGDRSRTGSTGEIGLMQIKYSTAISLNYPGDKWELFKADHNILIGTKLLARQRDRYNNDLLDVIAAYNQGSVFRWRKTEKIILPGINLDTALKYGHIIKFNNPYDRSQYGPYYNEMYVKKVIEMYDLFNQVIIKS